MKSSTVNALQEAVRFLTVELRRQPAVDNQNLVHRTEENQISLSEFALALYILRDTPEVKDLSRELAAFLTANCSLSWLEQAPLGDVFAVLNALHEYDASLIGGDHLARAVQRLLQAEVAPGGPYQIIASQAEQQSWDGTMGSKPIFRETDILTNAAVALFATWAAEPLPPTLNYLKQALNHTSPGSLRPETYTWLGFLPEVQAPLRKHLERAPQSTLRMPADISQASLVIKRLAESQRARTSVRSHSRNRHAQLNAAIFSTVRKELDALGRTFSVQSKPFLAGIERTNQNYEITLLPTFFGDGVANKTGNSAKGEKDQTELYIQLGSANVLGWLAATIYDHIMDDGIDLAALPLANAAHRRALLGYRAACADVAAKTTVNRFFDQMDAANALELVQTRTHTEGGSLVLTGLPAYRSLRPLAQRSCAHLLGPLIVAQRAGLPPQQLQLVEASLTNYLIARQLNDDAHDWQADVRAGQITYVVARLLKSLYKGPGTYRLDQIVPRMQCIFWEQISVDICRMVQRRLQLAKRQLQTSGALAVSGQQEILQLYETVARAARESQALRHDSKLFLERFSSSRQ